MDTFNQLMQGFAVALTPINRTDVVRMQFRPLGQTLLRHFLTKANAPHVLSEQ